MKSIAEKLISPVSMDTYSESKGLTYREWLIGMIASGCQFKLETPFAKDCIAKADAIIELLEKEDEKN
jgi:hypothetical protein